MTLLLIFFSILFLMLAKNRSLAWLLVTIQIVSIIGTYFLGREITIDTPQDYGWLGMMALLISLIILPWRHYYGVRELTDINPRKLKIVTRFLIVVNGFVFVVFLIAAIVVQTTVEDINQFKYKTGVSMDFYYNKLPIPTAFFNMSVLLYYFSYFIFPLHFYYLIKKNYLLAGVCFVFSLNIVLYGLTFFSRAVVVQFALMYMAMLYIFYGTLTKVAKKVVRVALIGVGLVGVTYFIQISQKRFDQDKSQAKMYADTIPAEAITQDPTTFGYLDYLSQGFLNGYEVLRYYEGEIFAGKLSLESVLAFFNTPEQTRENLIYRTKLWPYHYSYSFNGFTAYSIYDYGVFGSIIFCILYYLLVVNLRPKNNTIELKDLFFIVLLVQIPLMAIFYSQVGGILIALLLLIPLQFYIRMKVK